MINKSLFYVSSKEVYNVQHEVVDYGCYKDYILIKNVGYLGNKKSKFLDVNVTSGEEIERISKSRTIQKIKELVLCNEFEYFYTQTLKDNRYDLENFKKSIHKKFKAYKRINKNFIFLIIYEKHKDGAFHLHGLIGGVGNDLYVNNNGYYSLAFFEDLGFNSISAIKDKEKTSSYITKYISKDITKTDSNMSYFHSRGLKFARRLKFDDFDYSSLSFCYENEFIKIYKEKKQ